MLRRYFFAAFAATAVVSITSNALAADSAQNASGASTHASQAVTMGITASGQATLGVAAVPLLSVGAVGASVGAGSTALGKGSAAAAMGLPTRDPLPITDETITITPPSEALKQRSATSPR
jgi:hypothetical protein